ncbi:hypothetical protein ACFL3R_01335 [Thermodesulfobacteriota bacterium]
MKKNVFIFAVSLVLATSLFTLPDSSVAGGKVIGHWIDSSLYVGATYKIYIENGKTYLIRKFKDGSAGTYEVIKDAKSIGRATYRDPDDKHGDYYVINKKGYLEIRDSMGLIVTLDPLK